MSKSTAPVNAFFYQNPELLDRESHKGLRLQTGNTRFAAKNTSVPLLLQEFAQACLEFAIVFGKQGNGSWLAFALTGLQADSNAFVNSKGKWTARYMPASLRRYPFILAASPDQQLSVAIDIAAPHWGKTGEALFGDDGEPTELLQRLKLSLTDFQNQVDQTAALLQELDAAQLLEQQNLEIRLEDGRHASVNSVWIVNESKLRQLTGDKAMAWFKGGELALIHAHLLSLRNLLPLLERSFPAKNHAVTTANEQVVS